MIRFLYTLAGVIIGLLFALILHTWIPSTDATAAHIFLIAASIAVYMGCLSGLGY